MPNAKASQKMKITKEEYDGIILDLVGILDLLNLHDMDAEVSWPLHEAIETLKADFRKRFGEFD